MKIYLILIILFFGLSCSKPENNEKSAITERVEKDLDPTGNVQGPLTPKQIKEIERIHTAFSEVNSRSLDETINHFKHDQSPAREIAVWLKMAYAYERFTLNKHIEEYDKKYEAYQLIRRQSMMTEGDVMEDVDIIYLTKSEVKEILSYYLDQP